MEALNFNKFPSILYERLRIYKKCLIQKRTEEQKETTGKYAQNITVNQSLEKKA